MLGLVVGAAGLGLGASAGLVAAARYWAHRRMLLDRPNDRSLHIRPTPRVGGVGIVLPVCAALGYAALLAPNAMSAATWLACAGLLVAGVGFTDDIQHLPALTRLAAHVFAAVLVVAGIGAWRTFTWPGLVHVDLRWAAIPISVLLVTWLTNAYNFMDGVDGIAGGQGVVAGLGWLAAGLVIHDPLLAVVGSTVAASSLGFLFFNWAPASVFMGDGGSSFLGFLLAALAVYAASRSSLAATAGVLFVWPFVFDTTLTIVRRARRGENLLSAHRSHLYQRLVLTGVSHRTAALLYAALAAIGVVVGIGLVSEDRTASIGGACLIPALAAGLWVVVILRERAAAARS